MPPAGSRRAPCRGVRSCAAFLHRRRDIEGVRETEKHKRRHPAGRRRADTAYRPAPPHPCLRIKAFCRADGGRCRRRGEAPADIFPPQHFYTRCIRCHLLRRRGRSCGQSVPGITLVSCSFAGKAKHFGFAFRFLFRRYGFCFQNRRSVRRVRRALPFFFQRI